MFVYKYIFILLISNCIYLRNILEKEGARVNRMHRMSLRGICMKAGTASISRNGPFGVCLGE